MTPYPLYAARAPAVGAGRVGITRLCLCLPCPFMRFAVVMTNRVSVRRVAGRFRLCRCSMRTCRVASNRCRRVWSPPRACLMPSLCLLAPSLPPWRLCLPLLPVPPVPVRACRLMRCPSRLCYVV